MITIFRIINLYKLQPYNLDTLHTLGVVMLIVTVATNFVKSSVVFYKF